MGVNAVASDLIAAETYLRASKCYSPGELAEAGAPYAGDTQEAEAGGFRELKASQS